MKLADLPLLVCLFFTLYNVGVIWLLQLNHYPLYRKIGQIEFQNYLTAHNRMILLPIVVPGIAAFAAAALMLWQHPPDVPGWSIVLVISFNVVISLSTALVQGQAHHRLARAGYAEVLISRIIVSNWIRTVCWTINELLLIYMTALVLEK